jgi:hypothetical protein
MIGSVAIVIQVAMEGCQTALEGNIQRALPGSEIMLDDEAKSQILLMSSLLVVPNAEKALRALKDFRPIHVADVLARRDSRA